VLTMRGAPQFAMSRTGTLAYVPGGSTSASLTHEVVWMDRNGREAPVGTPLRAHVWARISPDGTKIALDIRDEQQDIWIFDLGRRSMSRLTTDPAIDGFPVWTPDGRRIVFESTRSGVFNLFVQPADGTGAAQQLTHSKNPMWPYSISPDGTHVVLQETTAQAARESDRLDLLALDGKSEPQPLIQKTPFVQTNAEISPNGRWLAYQSNESGRDEVYVRPFPRVDDGRWTVSTGGGTIPAWNPNGGELFYVEGGDAGRGSSMMAVTVNDKGTLFSPGVPTRLFAVPPVSGPPMRYYDVARDGQEFLMIKDPPASQQTTTNTIVVVVNWFEELRARMAAKR